MINTELLTHKIEYQSISYEILFPNPPYFVPRLGKTVEAKLNYQIWATIQSKVLPTHKQEVWYLVFPND
jgi:hypothetical protein